MNNRIELDSLQFFGSIYMVDKNKKEELRKSLTEEQYNICVLKETEAPFSGELLNNKENGIYRCIVCKEPLFSSKNKYDSKSGWPSFYEVLKKSNIKLTDDKSYGMTRTEVLCASCDSHLGHVFEDGPKDKTGKRYCINSVSLYFEPKDKDEV